MAAIYKSTEFFMLQDKSENFTDTVQFLDNRLADLGQFHQLKNQARDQNLISYSIFFDTNNSLNK